MTEVIFFDPRDKTRFVFHATPFRRLVVFVLRVMFALATSLPEDMRGVYAEEPKGFE